jgi:hypothetical protein
VCISQGDLRRSARSVRAAGRKGLAGLPTLAWQIYGEVSGRRRPWFLSFINASGVASSYCSRQGQVLMVSMQRFEATQTLEAVQLLQKIQTHTPALSWRLELERLGLCAPFYRLSHNITSGLRRVSQTPREVASLGGACRSPRYAPCWARRQRTATGGHKEVRAQVEGCGP